MDCVKPYKYVCKNDGKKYRTQKEIAEYYEINKKALTLHLQGKRNSVWVWFDYPEFHGVEYYFEKI